MNHFVQSLGAQQWTRQTQPYIRSLESCRYKQDPGDYSHVINAVGGKGRLLDTHSPWVSSQPGLRCPYQGALLVSKAHCCCMRCEFIQKALGDAEGMALLALAHRP